MKPQSLLMALLIVCVALLQNSQDVLAHETITVGDYHIEIGWLNEPALAGQLNAIVLYVINTGSGTELPMENISLLTVTLSYGGQEKLLAFEPLGGDTPGQFVAPILPAIAGEYEVILAGTLGGLKVDAETHMDEVQPTDALAFPSVGAAQTSSAGANWLVWLSIAIGLTGIGVGVLAFRKASTK